MCAIKDSKLSENENPLPKYPKIETFKEVVCEIRNCGAKLGRTIKYGRNLCDNCEEKLYG